MTASAQAFRWLPPFLVGVCAATSAEVAVGLLLYGGPGLMRSLTAVLAVEAAALGVGFLTAPGPRPDLVETLRRRWLLALVTFLVATLFSAFWSVVELVGGTALGQGLGLAFLAALPLYATGSLLGAMGTMAAERAPDGQIRGVGGPASLGAALGFAATGASLPQVFTPASLLLVCLVLLSAGGLVYGAVLDSRVRIHIRARRPSPFGEVRVEDRHLLARDEAARLLLEGEHLRRWIALGGDEVEPWEVSAWRELTAGREDGAVLFLGGGASTLPRGLLQERPAARVDVVERSLAVVELGREHLTTGLHGDADGRLGLHVGNVDDVLAALAMEYDLVLVDTAALAAQGGLGALSGHSRSLILGRVSGGGVLALGPFLPETGGWPFPDGWSVARYVRDRRDGEDGLSIPRADREELLAGSPDSVRGWPERIGAFVRAEGLAS